LFVGWAWYLVMLLPVLGIIQVGDQSHADRYTYLPQIGICLALIWPAAEWITNRTADTILMSAVVAVLMVCAWQQTAYWKDNETLWTHAIACTKDNAQAHNNLGTAYFNDGRMDDAMTECAEALRINPRLAMAHNILGIVLFQKGKTDEGIAQFQAALEITPEDAQVHNNLGNAYYHTGRLDDAVAQYEASLKTRPDVADTQYALGNILFQQGRMAEALAHLQKAVALNPGNQMMLTRLAWLLATCPDTTLRDGGKAVELARRANELPGGNNPLVLQTLAAAFAEAGQFPQAEATAQQALQLASTQPDSRLVGEIRYALSLYQAGSSFHLPQQAH
jgi:tetratricopeptide (TPR) repeat protein